MSYNNKVSNVSTTTVRNRYEVLESQHTRLQEISERLNIPQSALVRLAIDCFLPKIENMEVTDEGILTVWNRTKF